MTRARFLQRNGRRLSFEQTDVPLLACVFRVEQERDVDLDCRTERAVGYRNNAQIARVVTEEWCARQMYCPACKANSLAPARNNCPGIILVQINSAVLSACRKKKAESL